MYLVKYATCTSCPLRFPPCQSPVLRTCTPFAQKVVDGVDAAPEPARGGRP